MEISTLEVKRIARLARIAIDDAQALALRAQLTDIFALVEQMQAVDTSGVEPMAHPQSVTQRLREDRVTETDQHALLQQGAPAVEADLYLVPRVLE